MRGVLGSLTETHYQKTPRIPGSGMRDAGHSGFAVPTLDQDEAHLAVGVSPGSHAAHLHCRFLPCASLSVAAHPVCVCILPSPRAG